MTKKPQISTKAFWDTNLNSIDFEKQKTAVIARVFADGTWSDILAVYKYYGRDIIVESLTQTNYLKHSALNMASIMFEINKKKFKCFEKTQFQKYL